MYSKNEYKQVSFSIFVIQFKDVLWSGLEMFVRCSDSLIFFSYDTGLHILPHNTHLSLFSYNTSKANKKDMYQNESRF